MRCRREFHRRCSRSALRERRRLRSRRRVLRPCTGRARWLLALMGIMWRGHPWSAARAALSPKVAVLRLDPVWARRLCRVRLRTTPIMRCHRPIRKPREAILARPAITRTDRMVQRRATDLHPTATRLHPTVTRLCPDTTRLRVRALWDTGRHRMCRITRLRRLVVRAQHITGRQAVEATAQERRTPCIPAAATAASRGQSQSTQAAIIGRLFRLTCSDGKLRSAL